MVVVPFIIALFDGDLMATVGAVVSDWVMVTVLLRLPETFPAASFAHA